MSGGPGVVASGVTAHGSERTILQDVTLRAEPGEMVALTGPSGSGKTTMLSVVGGLIRPDAGTTMFAGEPTWTGSGDPRRDIVFVLQTYGLVSVLTVVENVSIGLRARDMPPKDADATARDALERVGVAGLGERLVQELSGGQIQRVACARALAVDGSVLLADEPTSELDEYNRERIVGELRRESDRGAVVILATHDVDVAARCDREYHLDDGALVSSPAP